MPPRPNLAYTWRVSIQSTSTKEETGRTAANIMYVTSNPSIQWGASDLVTLANDIIVTWSNLFKSYVTQYSSWPQVVVTSLDGLETQGVSTSTASAPTGATGPLPTSAAACLSWKIAAAYRGGHPRSYLPFLDSSVSDATYPENLISATKAAAIAADGDLFLSDMNAFSISGSNPAMGVVSYYRGKALRPTPVFYPYNQGTRVNTRLASQRRRLGKLSIGSYHT